MSLIESIIYMAWRGVAIGVLISAPMGPVGILCIQRTLEKGRKAGLYTGIGAALSDLFYSLLTGFGLSFIESFIERNQNVIQLLGSIVLIGFSIYLFRKNPSSSLRRPVPQDISAHKNILGGFLFTFSNPLILLLIIGLFARFNFLMPEMKFYHYIIGFIFLLAGALGWWYGVTFVIDKIRKRFSFRTMKKINIGIGIVILAFALVGIFTGIIGLTTPQASAAEIKHWNGQRGFSPFCDTTGVGTITLNNEKTAPAVFSVYTGGSSAPVDFRFTASNCHAHPMKRYTATDSAGKTQKFRFPAWGIRLYASDHKAFTILLSLEEQEGYNPGISLIPRLIYSERDTVTATKVFHPVRDGYNCSAGDNRYRLTVMDGRLRLTGGKRTDINIVSDRIGATEIDSIGFVLEPAAAVELSDITLRRGDIPAFNISHDTFPDLISLDEYLRHQSDLTEGYWQIFDYNMEDTFLRTGGDYRLAIVRRDDGYDILYLSGAGVNADRWLPLMIKGELHDTNIPGTYDLVWYDAYGAPMSAGLKAQRLDDDIITLLLPAQASSIRLHRIPSPVGSGGGFNPGY